MRAFALVCMVAILLPGCSGPDPEPMAEPRPEPLSVHAATHVTDYPVALGGGAYIFDSRNVSLNGFVQRYAVEALDNATITFEGTASAPGIAGEEGCLGLRVGTQSEGSSGLIFTVPASFETQARVAGREVSLLRDPFAGEGATSHGGFALNGTKALRTGERLFVDVAGTSAEPGKGFSLTLNATGPTRLLRLPDAALVCGAGTSQSSSQAGVSTYLVNLEAGGRIALATGNASTMVVMAQKLGDSEGWITFHDERVLLEGTYANASPTGGELAVELERWSEGAFSLVFFMSDVDWLEHGQGESS